MRFPKRLDPARSNNPSTALRRGDARFDLGKEIGETGRTLEIEGHFPFANAGQMVVSIGEARQDGGALQIDGSGRGPGV